MQPSATSHKAAQYKIPQERSRGGGGGPGCLEGTPGTRASGRRSEMGSSEGKSTIFQGATGDRVNDGKEKGAEARSPLFILRLVNSPVINEPRQEISGNER